VRFAQPARNKRPAAQPVLSAESLLPPLRGWNTRDPVANMAAGYATAMDNFWPTPGDVQARPGYTSHATGFVGTVKTLACWRSATGSEKLFGINDSGAFDVTSAGAIGAVSKTLTDGKCIPLSYTTTGGSFLFLVNGVDSVCYYDGMTWTSTASYAISGGGTLTSSNIVNISAFKRQLFFIEKDSMSFFYLPVDTITGTVYRYPMGAIFTKGGYLTAASTWTIDGGEGMDDYCVFATSRGQLAVFRGTDPSSASTWSLQGVYDLGEPLGKRCFLRYSGDLFYLSKGGLQPLSLALQSTKITNRQAVSDTIAPTFASSASSYGANYGWQGIVSPTDDLLLINIPTTSYTASVQYVMNTDHGAWARVTGWNATSFELMGSQLYMAIGTAVYKAWEGADDNGTDIQCTVKAAFTYLRSRGRSKHVRMIRPVFNTEGGIDFDIGMDADFSEGTDYTSSSISAVSGGVWDTAVWDTDVWASGPGVRQEWMTVEANVGHCVALRLRLAISGAIIRWSATDIAYETGGILG